MPAASPASAYLAEQGSDASSPDGPCSCVGTCHGGAAPPVVGLARPPALPDPGVAHTVLQRPPVGGPEGREVAYLLPYPTGPPTGVSA